MSWEDRFEAKIGFVFESQQNKGKEIVEIHRLYKEIIIEFIQELLEEREQNETHISTT